MAFFEARAQHTEGVTQNRFRDFWVWDSIAGGKMLVCAHSRKHGPVWGVPEMAAWALIFTFVYFV